MHLLQQWYTAHCDGQWEHQYGITIETLDNPGWRVTIDLHDTDCSNKVFTPIAYEQSADNWLNCHVSNNQFKGYGDSSKLTSILQYFHEWRMN